MIRLPATAAVFAIIAIVAAIGYHQDYGGFLSFVSSLCIAFCGFFLGWWAADTVAERDENEQERQRKSAEDNDGQD